MGIRILVIEDERAIADYLVRGLREEGFTVERAADGDEGWHYLNSQPWDVVLLDWSLPGADGLSLLKRFRQADQTTPVLFLTARDAVSDRVRGLDHGADDYLCKPFAFEELLARTRIYEHVWDERYDGLSNTLEVHVMELRKKLEAHGDRLIHTLRNQGYIFGDRSEVMS